MSNNLIASIRLCRFLGMFPPETGSKFVMMTYRSYQVVIFTIVCVVSSSMTIQLCVSTDMKMMSRTIDLWTLCWVGLYKWSYVVLCIDEFRMFHLLMDSLHVQATVAYGANAQQFTANRLKMFRTVNHLYILSGFFIISILTLGTMTTYPKGNRSELEYFNDPKSYPLCCWIPFTVPNYWTFVFLCVLEFSVLLIALMMFLTIDTYMFGTIYILGNQLDLLNETLSNIAPTTDDIRVIIDVSQYNSANNQLMLFNNQRQMKCFSSLTECIKLHGLIIKSIRSLQDMFSTLILFDYLHGMISMTFLLVQTLVSNDFRETISLYLFLLLSLYHQLLNNFFGEFIIQKQISVQNAAYNFPWLYVNKKSRRLLTLMICIANRPLMITGFYMYRWCYRSFLVFNKALYTYYMVLRNLNFEVKNE